MGPALNFKTVSFARVLFQYENCCRAFQVIVSEFIKLISLVYYKPIWAYIYIYIYIHIYIYIYI